jgi:hypothetical protein
MFFSAFGVFAGIGLVVQFRLLNGLLAAIVGLVAGYVGRPGNV